MFSLLCCKRLKRTEDKIVDEDDTLSIVDYFAFLQLVHMYA